MQQIINSVVSWYFKKRMHQMELFIKYPYEVQTEIFNRLIENGEYTEWGEKYKYHEIRTYADFKKQVPISHYEDLKPYIERLQRGEKHLLWPSEVKWFAKSSGTTSEKSKFIPITKESLEECHYKGGKDLLSLYVNNYPDTKLFSGKALSMVGSQEISDFNQDIKQGDLSAILFQNIPTWLQFMRTPDLSIALMDEWESKIDTIARTTMKDDVTNLSGVPSWVLVLINKILEISGKKNIVEVWPNLEAFFHGGVNFMPYQNQYKKIAPANLHYVEVYNASEGYFGLQDLKTPGEMLLMLDYGVFYEFIPMEDFESENPQTLIIGEVELNKNYAMVISTNGGLWRYVIGDTIKFTSLDPYRIQLTGRTKNFINAFGEELILDNAEKAISFACKATNSEVTEYTAAPIYFTDKNHAAHQWIIEFSKAPASMKQFNSILDSKLKDLNSDYEAKRYKNMILLPPVIDIAPIGTFFEWMKKRGKLGGQHKVPRLSNHRQHIDSVMELIK